MALPTFEILKRDTHPRYRIRKNGFVFGPRCWTYRGAEHFIASWKRSNLYLRTDYED